MTVSNILSENSSSDPLSSRGLPRYLEDIIYRIWKEKGVAFVQEGPNKVVTGPTIVWKVYRRLPGREGLERYKPRQRLTTQSSSESIETDLYAQYQTIYYQFDIYDGSNTLADNLLEEFEALLFSLVPLLKNQGVSEFLFDEEFEDTRLKVNQDNIFVRSLRYLCILEKRYAISRSVLREIQLRLLADESVSQTVVLTRGTGGDTDPLPDLWVSAVYNVSLQALDALAYQESPPDGYIFGVDYTLTGDSSTGAGSLTWLAGGARPSPGASYYARYSLYKENGLIPIA